MVERATLDHHRKYVTFMALPATTIADAKLVLDRERPELDPARPADKSLYVERELDIHETLITEALSAVASKRPFRWFFTGHTGAGKSTELNRVIRTKRLTDEYLPHIFRVRDSLDVHNLDFTDLILGMAHSVASIAKDRRIAVPKALQQRMAKWGSETELVTELGVSGKGKVGAKFDAWIFKASAEVQAGGEKRKIVREKIHESLTDFIKLIDDLVRVIEKKAKKKVLVVIDTLDHVDHRPIREIFTNHWSSLSKPNVSLLTVISLPMLLEPKFMAKVQSNYSLLPNVKVFQKPGSTDLDSEGYEFFVDVIGRLADISLFSDEALKELFRLSGGMLRDMIGFAGDACKYADIDNVDKVGASHVNRVLDERKAYFRRLLKASEYEILKNIDSNPLPLGIEGLGPLLELKAVIFYPNGEGWYGLNPAVQSILEDAAG